MMSRNDYLTSLFGLDGQNAVIIGGTGVLCGQMAKALSRAGANVVIAGRSQEKASDVIQTIESEGGNAIFEAIDVCDRQSVQSCHDACLKHFGKIDILINGAGVNHAALYHEINDDDWSRIINANLGGVHLGTQIFTESMKENGGGCVINLSSVSSEIPLSRVFAYSASKAAVVNYTKNVARELAVFDIRVNCVTPGFFPAEQNRKILDEQRIQSIFARTPMNRFGEPQELDGAVLLLASPLAGKFITGTEVVVDGGFTCMSI